MGSLLMNGWRGVLSSFLAFLTMVLKRCRHMLFLYALAYGNFLQTLCFILNMCISSLLVMHRNRCAKIGERL